MSVSEREERLAQELGFRVDHDGKITAKNHGNGKWESARLHSGYPYALWQNCLSLLERLEQSERSRDDWMTDAKRNEENRDYWKQRHETAQLDCNTTMSRLEQAEGILRELAEIEPTSVVGLTFTCELCSRSATVGDVEHDESCPYRRAQQYLEGKR